MANFVSTWLDHGCPDIWSNIILNVSVRVFLNEINITLPNVSGPHPISWMPEQNKKADPSLSKSELPPAQLPELDIGP